ncbi:MAG: PVC-type heme-binding CxxCH protein [Pirellulaceae bacterium]
MPRTLPFSLLLIVSLVSLAGAADGNRLAYLDGPLDPYYPHREFPKLITPQWVGEEGVECVVTLAIDDMRESAKYEAYLRPILDRLKKIDGRAAVSIMACRVDPQDPQLQAWLREGLSIEVHTYDHPCPCLQEGGLVKAKETYDKCVDLMNEIPGNKPVAFRMPCCDSKNTPSPRFWAEAFNKTTAKGNFLQIDSSIFNIITNKDKSLAKEITELPDGSERFRRYVPFTNFVNTIEDYPYPYVIGGMCWEFPCVVPSDWSAQHVQKPNNPDTVRDWKLALDACVVKQGVFNLVFHPHGWIRNDQIVELIDHAVTKHGKKVKFLTFKECAERLNKNLLLEQPIRNQTGAQQFTFLRDSNKDGLLDVHLNRGRSLLRTWNRSTNSWEPPKDNPVSEPGIDEPKHRLRDIDGDGAMELIVPQLSEGGSKIFDLKDGSAAPFNLPKRSDLDFRGLDTGLRLIDINGDGKLDCLFSNHERYWLYLFKDMKEGWSIRVFDVERGKDNASGAPAIPPFVRADGTNNGAWFHSGALWLQNEETWRLPDNVFKLTFKEMLASGGDAKANGDDAQASGGRQPPEENCGQEPEARGQESATSKIEMTRPLSPDESLEKLHVLPGFKVELVAAEPLVVDPVAFDWGPDGRLWVVEMRDYPSGITWKKEGDEFGKPGGRVKVLTDTDGDGRYDQATVFLDGLPFPTGVKVWRKGILVTAAPDILYAEDTDGDGQADVQKVLYRGFGEGNQQHRVNGLRWGLDNWLYVGNGDSGGIIKSLSHGIPSTRSASEASSTPTRSVSEGPEINVNGRDLRIHPDTGELDSQSGQTQFGRERDDWGNWFGGNNSDPMWHYTLADHYLRRNPHFAPPSTHKQVSVSPGAAPVFPRSLTLTRFNDANKANRFTSACSQMIYRDDLLGPEFAGNSFVCEPVHNLVHREIVSPEGSTFTSRRAAGEEQSEFLASEDSWFRPSMCRTGPDGALWVADMYRFVIEHPKWIPAEFQQQLELRAGEDKGRIYRIYPENSKPRPVARLDKLDAAGLVAALDTPNGPQRDLVQQLLVWQPEQAAIEPLVKLAKESLRPQARLQALCTLDGLGAVSDELLLAALADDHPGVVRHAVRLAEPRLAKSPALQAAVLKLTADPDLHVQMQVAYSLGAWDDARSAEGLATLLAASAQPVNRYLTAAAMSSLNKQNIATVLARVLSGPGQGEPAPALVEQLFSIAAATGNDAALREAVDRAVTIPTEGIELWQLAAIGRFLDELAKRKVDLQTLTGGSGRDSLEALFGQARSLAQGEGPRATGERGMEFRTAAIRLLGRGLSRQEEDIALLGSLLSPQQPSEVQTAAAAALARTARPDVPQLLLAGWPSHTPAVRGLVLDTLASREAWAGALLDAVEQGKIPGSQIDARRRQQFATAKSETLRRRAEKVLASAVDSDRQKLVEQYVQAAASHQADIARGKLVFTKRCANCHRLGGEGHSVGPDLAALNNRSRDVLFIAMLDPNRAIEDRYLDYVVRLADGRTVTGLLREETGASITLAAAEGKTITILRSEIDQLRSSGKSLMPEGIEKDISPAEMADLSAYLQQNTPPPKQLAGNQPEVVRPFVDGSIRLLATNARVYGPTLVLEEKYRNLGWWNSLEDHVAWSFETPAAGEYRVVLDYACETIAAGNGARVIVAGQTLGCVVEGTGTWDDYRGKDLGVIKLPEGPGELVVRSDGPINHALFDLRGVRLAPVKK